MSISRFFVAVLFALSLSAARPALAQEHAPKPVPPTQGQAAVPEGAQPAHPPETKEAEHEEGGILPVVARLFNFAVLVGALVYFLRAPIAQYLASRHSQIRQDLVTAADMRAAASAQLAEIEKKMSALPGELEQLRRQGAADVKSEQARIGEATAHERQRLLDQTRREIDMRLRVAKRELTEHAAQLAVQVAEQRIKRSITADDQTRLVQRYASQLREAR